MFKQIFLNEKDNYRTSKLISQIFYIFFALPTIIFIWGWFKPIFSIPISIIIFMSLYFACKNAAELYIPEMNKTNNIKIAMIILIVGVWVYYSGIGGFVFQNSDHSIRNAIFEDLVNKPWPVIDSSNNVMLVYYIAFWLPSALLGKIFGMNIGYIFQSFWAILFILFMYYFICAHLKKVSIWPLALFIFFSGMDVLLPNANIVDFASHIEWHEKFQLSSMTTQLFWVFNQSLAAWAATIFLLLQKNSKSMIFILSLLILYAPFPFIGLMPFAAYFVLYEFPKNEGIRLFKNSDYKRYFLFFKENIFTFENIAGGLAILTIIYLYFSANISGKNIVLGPDTSFNVNTLMSIFIEILIPVILILYTGIRKPIIILTTVVLILCPFIKIGYSIDFLMRASIPALFILYLLTIEATIRTFTERNFFKISVVICIILLGAITPLHEIYRTYEESSKLSLLNLPMKLTPHDYWTSSGAVYDNFLGSMNSSFWKIFSRR